MTPDDAHTSHNHGFELPNAPQVVVQGDPRPWRAVAGVAVCLGLAGMIAGLIVARRQSASDAHLTSDALQREELRDGWRALGAAAASDARASDVPAPTVETTATVATAAPAPSPNVVIVNLPAQPNPAQPTNVAPSTVTNINLPTSADPRANGAVTDSSGANPGFVPTESLLRSTIRPCQATCRRKPATHQRRFRTRPAWATAAFPALVRTRPCPIRRHRTRAWLAPRLYPTCPTVRRITAPHPAHRLAPLRSRPTRLACRAASARHKPGATINTSRSRESRTAVYGWESRDRR